MSHWGRSGTLLEVAGHSRTRPCPQKVQFTYPAVAGLHSFSSSDARGRACRRQRTQLVEGLLHVPALLVRDLPAVDPLPQRPLIGYTIGSYCMSRMQVSSVCPEVDNNSQAPRSQLSPGHTNAQSLPVRVPIATRPRPGSIAMAVGVQTRQRVSARQFPHKDTQWDTWVPTHMLGHGQGTHTLPKLTSEVSGALQSSSILARPSISASPHHQPSSKGERSDERIRFSIQQSNVSRSIENCPI